MKRYIVDKSAIELIKFNLLDAQTELASNKTITNEALEYSHLPFLSVVLSDKQVKLLRKNGIECNEELVQDNVLLAENTGYEKLRSLWIKPQRRAITGKNVKVGVLDTGCNSGVVPYDYAYNFVDNNTNVTDVFGHGTIVCSIIKHPTIAVAPDCELHMLKCLTDGGLGNESAILAGLNYAITNNLDIINLSWQFDTTAIRSAIATVVATNCIVSAASGNSSSETYTAVPACLPGVVAVNAVDASGNPAFKNVLPNPAISGSHGVTIACNGVSCQSYNKDGNYAGCWGTSCSSPFFVGVFAMYKEQLKITDNQRILQYILRKAKKITYSDYYGAGLPTF